MKFELVVAVRPDLLPGTRHMLQTEASGLMPASLIVWSMPVARLMLAQHTHGLTFAAWHDDALNCGTWTDAGGCRCEVST